jgi:acyl-CoA thioester hydrolase
MMQGDSTSRNSDSAANGAPSHAVCVEMEVPLHDVDPLNVVWHGHYFKYLDRARTELLRAHGIDLPDLATLRHRMLIVDAACRYISPLKYAEKFRVAAWVTAVDPRIRIAYSIWNITQARRSARAYTVIVTTDADGRLLWRTPPVLRDRLAPHLPARDRTRDA